MFTFTICFEQTNEKPRRPVPGRAHELSSARRGLKASTSYLALLTLLLLLVPNARAQVLYGSLVGNVTDPNGAAISGAKVEITNVATGAVTTTTTDDRGAYVRNDLQAGSYKVAISQSTFKTTVKEDVRIEANKTYRFDAQLAIGGVEETVLVTTAGDTLLQTDRGDANVTQTAREV